MEMTAEAPCQLALLLEESGKHCNHREIQADHGLHVRARVATAIIVLVAVVAMALLAVGSSGASNSKLMLVNDRVVRDSINYKAEVEKIVKCRFQLLVDEHDIGQIKPTGDGVDYASCITDDMDVYYLLVETHKILSPESKLHSLEKVTRQSTAGGAKPSWERQNVPLYRVLRTQSITKVARWAGTERDKSKRCTSSQSFASTMITHLITSRNSKQSWACLQHPATWQPESSMVQWPTRQR